MLKDISVSELFELEKAVVIDVRSEHEFHQGTIPGAINIPLFNNEERTEIGTVYNNESPEKATELGLKIVSGKLYSLYKQINEVSGENPVILFCWRGGMRSRSLAVVLDLMGLNVLRLCGGYKAYRNFIVGFFEKEFPFHVIVLKGNTGTGKTELLLNLKEEGYPVLDLEGLANHRGSVFGGIGLGTQPTQKQFESLIYREITNYQMCTYVIVECESKRIGRLILPDSLVKAMQEGTEILVYDTLENRTERIIREYVMTSEDIAEFSRSLLKLKKRLGNATVEKLLSYLEEEDFQKFAAMLMNEYYDKLYGYPNEENDCCQFCINNGAPEKGIKELKEFLDRNYGFIN